MNVLKQVKQLLPDSLYGTFEGYTYELKWYPGKGWGTLVHKAPEGMYDVYVWGLKPSWQLAKKHFIAKIRYYERYMGRVVTAPTFRLDPKYIASDLHLWPELAELQHHEFKLIGGCFDLSHISTQSLTDSKEYSWHSHELLGFREWLSESDASSSTL